MTPEQSEKSTWQPVFTGELFEIEQREVGAHIHERARRAPGTRTIVLSHDGKQILLTHERREELGKDDYRLPGGKVFDSWSEYAEFLKTDKDLLEPAISGAKLELRQEAGLRVNNLELFKVTKAGGTVEWDLYYFVATDWHEHQAGQQLEEGECITTGWYDLAEAARIALDGDMNEDRSLGILLQWLYGKGVVGINQ